MKRSLIFASLAFLSLTAFGKGITITATKAPAEKVFADIIRQSGKNYLYSAGLLNGITVSVNLKESSLETALSRMFSGTDIAYRIKGNNVVLSKKAVKHNIKQATLSGFVRDAENGEALAGVLVATPDRSASTFTNAMGFYSLRIPTGKVSLNASFPGFSNYSSGDINLKGNRTLDIALSLDSVKMLDEVTVTASLNNTLALESSDIGSLNVSSAAIMATPVVLGEKDVIKTLQLEPGISAGIEGMAGMYVHGGNTDENLYMLDNIPLYQVNHFGGFFSAFNTEALRNVDFYKSSFPAKYDGRLSSYLDVHTKDGSLSAWHGSGRLGLVSGAFNIDGPIWKDHTSLSLAVRRSWYDVLTLPAFAIYNALSKENSINFNYAFTDVNVKLNHHFSPRSRMYAMFYYGDDYLSYRTGSELKTPEAVYQEEKDNLRWGNIVGSLGWNYVLSPQIFMEITGAYTRYSSRLNARNETGTNDADLNHSDITIDHLSTKNSIDDWILRADFDWRPHPLHSLQFGAGYTFHSFLPSRTQRNLITEGLESTVTDATLTYHASEGNFYFGGDWKPGKFRIGYGLHYSLFSNDNDTHSALSPRLSVRFTPAHNWAVKAAYSRTVQYVHQLQQSSISLPTDQWVPIVGKQLPQTADKIAAGVYYNHNNQFTLSVEAYWKWMHNLLDYADEYYLLPPETVWNERLVAGSGTAKGIDFKISREFGKITGHVAYSLLWADRCFADINHGKRFPARNDNRHKINVMLSWKINDRWEVAAAWTGMSGNRFTLPAQVWEDPMFAPWHYDMPYVTEPNNYRLPFYHRLDLSAKRYTKHGYWEISLYNAYCNLNTIAVRRDYTDKFIPDENGDPLFIPVYQKIKLIPIIPSFSYTWLF